MATGGDLDRFNRNAASRRAVTRDALKSSRTWQFIWKFGEPDEISCWLNGLGNAWKITGTLVILLAEDRKGRRRRKEKMNYIHVKIHLQITNVSSLSKFRAKYARIFSLLSKLSKYCSS